MNSQACKAVNIQFWQFCGGLSTYIVAGCFC